MRPRIGLAITAFGLAALTACSSPAQQPSTAAPAAGERTLTVYSGRDEELVGPLLERFEQESGIRVEARYGSTNEMAAQIQEEGEQTPAQVFLAQDAGALGLLSAAGRFAPLPAEVTGAVPAEYTSQDGSWVGLTGRARVVAYDSQTVPAAEAPGDIRTLTDPKWRGQVAIAPTNAGFQAHITAMRVTEGEDATRAWLEGLRANDVQIHQSNGAILEAVNAGAAKIGLINHYYWTRAEGDPTAQRAQLKYGDPGSISALVNVSGAGILTGAAASAEAQELVRYLVSPAAQAYFGEETTEYPLVAGAPQPAGAPALAQLGGPELNLSDLASLEQTVALIQSVGLI